MSALGWVGVGAAGMFAVGVVVAFFVERGSLRVLIGFLLAVLAAPVLLTAALLRRADALGSARLTPDALARFARTKREGGGNAHAFFYSRRAGVIFVRALHKGGPTPPEPPVRLAEPWQMPAEQAARETHPHADTEETNRDR